MVWGCERGCGCVVGGGGDGGVGGWGGGVEGWGGWEGVLMINSVWRFSG